MTLKRLFLFLISCSLLSFFIISFSILANSKANAETPEQNPLAKDVARFNRELQIIKNEYVNTTSEHELLQNAMQGMASGLDPHSSFLDAEELKDLKTATTGQFSGLGLEVAMEEGLLRVITPIDDGPAQKAGIKPGDWILRINNSPIQGLSLREAVKKMRGTQGSSIQLLLVRQGIHKPLLVNLKREIIHVHSVKGRLLEPEYAYIRINSFQESTRHDLDKLITQFQQNKKTSLKGIILDLRNNPGGLLSSATEVANAFLDPQQMKFNQLIVFTKGQSSEANMKIAAKPNNQIYAGTLIVLINQGSASGAEIVAGALQDNKRAVILGTKSFGKGSVQTVIPLDESTALKLTTALYYTPSGRSIQAAGISPDVTLDELKINTLAQNPSEPIYLHEAELKGHLKNGNTTQKNIFSPATITNTDLVKNDYQLFEALNLLKSMVVLQAAQTTSINS